MSSPPRDAQRPRLRPSLLAAVCLAAVTVGAPRIAELVDPANAPELAADSMTFVHVKWRERVDVAHLHASASPLQAYRAEPLFTSIADAAAFGEVDDADPRLRWSRIPVPRSQAARLAEELGKERVVEQAFVEPEVTLATSRVRRPITDDGDSCPITTPSFESYQGYLAAAPHGIDAPAAWRRGHRGAGVWFADVEGGWNATHEDLPGDRITHVAGAPIRDRSWRAHGTAVLGEVVGKDNGKGVVGIAPDVERVFTASIGGIAVADAIDLAARQLRAGDVLLIELQVGGPRGRYLPVEFFDDTYDAIVAATKRGVIVIEAAGNGAEDLDHPTYKGKFDRAKRDSGAIMIGAGGPPREGFRDRERLDFSNFGGRVDVQGWGRKVATLDYGDLQACDDDQHLADRHYTNEFSGTSSASPIVAGAAVILQGIARQQGRVLAPHELRALLRRTGTPQAGNVREQIGPRPDLARAIRELDRR